MSTFLQRWDVAIKAAKAFGYPIVLSRWERTAASEDKAIATARTRHPAFMFERPVKHDPERDNV
jgi:hypothetical protein